MSTDFPSTISKRSQERRPRESWASSEERPAPSSTQSRFAADRDGYPGCGVIQRRFEIIVAEILPENFNILVRGVCHGVGKKALRKFKGFFWGSKPEDALCEGQKFVGVNHRSLACEAKP